MSYSLKKINDVKVTPITTHKPKPEEIKGYNIIPEIYANIYICGRKNSGKTNVLFTIMKQCTNKKTIIIIYCSTHHSDYNWIEIKKWLKKKKQPHHFYDSILDDNNESNVQALIDKITADHVTQQEQDENKNKSYNHSQLELSMFDKEKITHKKEKKEKKAAPDYLIIFDDISKELRNKKEVETLLKQNRHYRSKTIISSQYPYDIVPSARQQIDFWCIFGGFNEEKIKKVFPELDIFNLDFEKFYMIYKMVTSEPHHFFYVNRVQNELRKDFNQKIYIK